MLRNIHQLANEMADGWTFGPDFAALACELADIDEAADRAAGLRA